MEAGATSAAGALLAVVVTPREARSAEESSGAAERRVRGSRASRKAEGVVEDLAGDGRDAAAAGRGQPGTRARVWTGLISLSSTRAACHRAGRVPAGRGRGELSLALQTAQGAQTG